MGRDSLTLAYLAGFLDGEGCFRFHRGTPRIQCSNTYYPALGLLQARFGGRIYRSGRRKPGQRIAWAWEVYGEGAVTALLALREYLHEKREQCEIVLQLRHVRPSERGTLLAVLSRIKRRETGPCT